MWIDLYRVETNDPVPLSEAVSFVIEKYSTSLVAEGLDLRGGMSFRHAVCIVKSNGEHWPRLPRIEELAGQLLSEYGLARGGTPAGWDVVKWNYGTCVGYAMSFVGGPTEPVTETRLKNSPSLPGTSLKDREELYTYEC